MPLENVDGWGVFLAEEDEPENEFVVALRDTNAPQGKPLMQTSGSISEAEVYEILGEFGVPRQEITDAITSARATKNKPKEG